MEDYRDKCKKDMEFEAVGVIRDLYAYAEDSDIEPYFVLESFLDGFHKHKEDKDIRETMQKLCDNG